MVTKRWWWRGSGYWSNLEALPVHTFGGGCFRLECQSWASISIDSLDSDFPLVVPFWVAGWLKLIIRIPPTNEHSDKRRYQQTNNIFHAIPLEETMLSRSGSSDGEVEEQSCDVSIAFLYDEQLGDLTVGPRLGEQLGSPKDDGGHLYIHISDTPLTTLVPLFETLVQWPAQLARLVELRASHNQLTSLPADLAQSLPSLVTLDISHNSLSELPDWIGVCCPQLRRLRIDGNAISSVPRTFSRFAHLKTFFYGQNPLPTVPKDVRLRGCAATLNYLIDSTAPSEVDIFRSSDSDEASPFDSDLDSFDTLSPSFNSPARLDDSPLRERRPLPAARSRSPGVFLAQNRWRLSGTDTGPAPRQRNSWVAPEPSKPRHHSRQFLLNRSPLLSDSFDLYRSSTASPS